MEVAQVWAQAAEAEVAHLHRRQAARLAEPLSQEQVRTLL